MLFGRFKSPSIRKNVSSIFKKTPKITQIVQDADTIAMRAQELIEKELEPEVTQKQELTMIDFFKQEEITKIIIEMSLAKMPIKKQCSILKEAAGGHEIPHDEYQNYVEHIFRTIAKARELEKEETAEVSE